MKKMDLRKIARDVTLSTFGFAPALSAIVLLESSEDRFGCVALSWAVNCKGYSWRDGFPVCRDEAYDLHCI